VPKRNKPMDVFKFIDMKKGDIEVCWPWKRKLNKGDNRPYITIDGSRRPSYVVVYELFTGEEAGDRVARHSCDNPVCCNPHHLSWGSHQDNSDDMKERERHGLPKTVIRAIRKLLNDGRTQSDIADLYGVSRETISAIATERIHRDK
jgi:hypothetical protein